MADDDESWELMPAGEAAVAVLQATVERLRRLGVPSEDLCLVVPAGMLTGLSRCWGVVIERLPVDRPLVGVRGLQRWAPPEVT